MGKPDVHVEEQMGVGVETCWVRRVKVQLYLSWVHTPVCDTREPEPEHVTFTILHW